MGSRSAVERDGVPIGIGEREGAPEGTVEGSEDNRGSGYGERVVDVLSIGCVHPHADAGSGLSRGVELGAGDDLADGEGRGLGVEDDGVRGATGGSAEAEVLLVERGGGGEVANLQGDEVGADGGNDAPQIDVRCLTQNFMSDF
jgi:hypothetical protein